MSAEEEPAKTEQQFEERVVQRDLVVVGASAGGVEALQRLVSELPAELPASILVVLHLMSEGTSVLDEILGRSGFLRVTQARDEERLERGHVYVAPPDFHMLVRGDQIHLSAGPRENGSRPAIDPLFRSAARAYGPRAIGVVLTGNLDDGTDGLLLLKEHGAATVAQDPDDAAFPDMPRNAIAHVDPDYVCPLDELPDLLCELLDVPLEPAPAAGRPDPREQEADLVEMEFREPDLEGDATLVTCPECGGVLMETFENGLIRYACQVGHAYSPESLVNGQARSLETALWNAQRTLDERADVFHRMARRARRRPGSGAEELGERYEHRAAAVREHADVIRATIIGLREAENGHEREAEPEEEPTR